MKRFVAVLFALTAILQESASGQEQVVPQDPLNSYFGAQKAVLNYRIAAPTRPSDRVTWTVAVRDQVIANRDARPAAADNGATQFAIELELPEARPGIVLPLTVVVSVNGEKSHRRNLWVFPEDAFAEKYESLASQRIVLFDPEKKTSSVFERSKIPFVPERNVDALSTLTNGTLVIGEGVSFRDYRTLGNVMVTAASRGVNVVCLAPSGGEISFPGTEHSELPQPAELLLRRNDVIRQFDRRFDSRIWSPDGKVVASSVLVTGQRNGVTGVVTADGRGWPWIDVRFSGSGRLVICGFAIIGKWDSGPTPRYLLAHVLGNDQYATRLTNDPSVDSSVKGRLR